MASVSLLCFARPSSSAARRGHRHRLPLRRVPALMATGLFLWSVPALGSENLAIDEGETVQLGGDRLVFNATIAGTINVIRYDPANPDSGWLRIRAHTITLGPSGVINASSAGYQGSTADSGGHANGAGAGATPTPADNDTLYPGGGGAHFGVGGQGTDFGCQLVLGQGDSPAAGGIAYDLDPDPLGIEGRGSAGGLAHAGEISDGTISRGGHGGGVVILEAGLINLNGRILADGESAGDELAAPGGGAGGTIIIRTPKLTFTPASAPTLSARGALGGHRADLSETDGVIGGSGGGGRIDLDVDLDDLTGLATFVQGGSAQEGNGSLCTSTAGGDGQLTIDGPPDCFDHDGDGATNVLCGGDDCDDAEPDAFPDNPEVCNGRDDNCNNDIDEDPDALCVGASATCVSGTCVEVEVDAGVPDASDAGISTTPEIRFGGGLCTLPGEPGGAPSDEVPWVLLFAGTAGAAALLRRR